MIYQLDFVVNDSKNIIIAKKAVQNEDTPIIRFED